ncbi:putative HNHc nuclease [Leuconostoc citreum]|uniref:putative HNHc nuclease n=1 Tax=Leuconostoc citreum TaxID=33964 RepID=UPI0020A02B52|nr:putative HNHc nuclease [Leuconostoc citreum]MCP1276289.1 putative HNHc nuclease [Leuconostoc citreum]
MKEFQAYPTQKAGNEILFRFRDEESANQFLSTFQLFKQTLVEIQVRDDREISAQQRKFIYALFRDISNWSGDLPEYVKQLFKMWFEQWKDLDEFSLRDVEKSVAAGLITFMLDFVAEHNVPLSFKPLDALEPEDIAHFEYACLMNKCCVICGKKPSDLHHLDTIGQGVDRRKTNHLKHRAVQLCRIHHNEAHSLGIETFLSKYHVNGIKIDERIAKVHRLNIKGREV